MGQQASGVMNVANAFAEISGRAAAQANANRAAIANANIAAETVQQDLALQQERSRLAQAFSSHQGTLATNAAFRGGSAADRDTQDAVNTAAIRASQEGAIATANRSAQRAATIARHQFIEEDVTLASIEGGMRGLNLGMQIAGALQQATEIRRRQFTETFGDGQTFGFNNVTQDVAFTPGLDLTQLGDTFNFGFNLG